MIEIVIILTLNNFCYLFNYKYDTKYIEKNDDDDGNDSDTI